MGKLIYKGYSLREATSAVAVELKKAEVEIEKQLLEQSIQSSKPLPDTIKKSYKKRGS